MSLGLVLGFNRSLYVSFLPVIILNFPSFEFLFLAIYESIPSFLSDIIRFAYF